MAVIVPKRLATVRATWGCADFATGELLLEARIGPDRFAFITQDTARESASAAVLTDPHSAKSISANRAMLDVDQKRLGHRKVTG